MAKSVKCSICGETNPARMRFCGGCGQALVQDASELERPREAPQRRHMTVMFCDLVDSTPLAESLEPEDYRDVVLAYQQVSAAAIERYDGHIARYMGDGILVYFGYPRAHEDDALRAVHAGLGILDAVATLNRQLADRYDVSLHVRIGVHTGLVIAGEMGGGDTRDELAIIGETPNIAARIESIADADTLVISDSTLALVEGFFETRPLDERPLKGVSRNVLAYEVLRASGVQHRLDLAPARGPTVMIGRADELDRVTEIWKQARGGDGAVAHVFGEAGIGKSRFVRELRARIGDDVAELQSWRCSAYHQNSALFPVIDYLERKLALDVAHRGDDALHVLEETAAEAGLERDGTVPLLAELLSVPCPDNGQPLASLDVRAETMRILEQVLVTNPTNHPLLLVVEDLHWADPTTIDLLGRVVRHVPSNPVLALFTYRPDFAPPWSDGSTVDVALKPLGADDVTSMISALASAGVDPDLLARVVEAADGVPLFVEEMLKMVAAAGAETTTSGITVPSTLRSLLTERLDRLPQLRDVIDAAAVVGRGVSRELLEHIAPSRQIDIEAALQALVSHDVLRPSGDGSTDYEFSHMLLQEAAYDSVLRSRRQDIHRQVAETLLDRFSARAEREPELVAHHLQCGREPLRSVRFWYAAGRRAIDRAAFVEAAGHFGRGVDALDADADAPDLDIERAEFLSHLAASLQAGRGYAAPGVDDAYARARSACTHARREDRMVSVIRGEWMLHLLRAEYGTAFELANEMLALSGRTGRPEDLAEGNLFRGMVHMYRGELESARQDFESSIAHYHRPEHPDQVYEAQGDTGVGALAYLAPVLAHLGCVDEALEHSDRCLVLADDVGGPVTRAQAWGMRALFHLDLNDVAWAQWAERTRRHSRDRKIPYWMNVSEILTAWLRGRMGRPEDAIADVEAGLQRYLDSGARLGLPVFRMLLGDLREFAGDHERALVEIEAAERFIEGTGERWSEADVLLSKGRTLMSGPAPDPEAARRAFVTAVGVTRVQRARLLELRAVTQLTEHELTIGSERTEVDALAALCDSFPSDSTLIDVTSGRAALARVEASA